MKGFRKVSDALLYGYFVASSHVVDRIQSKVDKVEFLFSDVETEGKKHGYEKAKKEYEIAFRIIETEYKKAIEIIKSKKNMYAYEEENLIQYLENLEIQRQSLEEQAKNKMMEVSKKHNIPFIQIQNAFATNFNSPTTTSLFGIIYNHKEKKFKEAELLGYNEAKKLFEEKLNKQKQNLTHIKNNLDIETQNHIKLMEDILLAISNEQSKIAELKLFL